jgi:hypothetical protein
MKKAMILSVILITGMFYMSIPVVLQAQDDLYYNPRDNRNVSNMRGGSTDTYAYDDSGYDDGYDNDMYDYYDDYDYQYSTRIRRFNRVNPGFGYYDPFFVDPFFYDPFMMAHYNPFMYRPFNPWVRGHRFRMMYCPFGMGMGMGFGNPWGMGMGFGYNPWGMGMGFGYNPWGMGMGYNPWGMGMGYNPWGMGYGMPFYGNGMGWGNQGYWDGGGFNGGTTPNTVYTPRRGGAVTTTDRATVRQPQADRSDRVKEADQANRDVQTGGRLTPQTGDQGRNTVRTPASATPDQPISAGDQRMQGGERPQDATPSRRFFTVDRNNPDNRQAPSMDRSSQDMNQRGNMRQAPPAERQDNRRIQTTPRSRENTPNRSNNSGGNMRSNDRSSSPSMSPPSRSSSHSMSPPSRSSSPSMSSPSRGGGGGGGGGRTSPRG